MKAVQKTLLASLLAMTACQALVSTSAMAAESIDIKVIGTITPAACKPVLNGGNVVDYGTISADKIAKDNFTVLQVKSLPFSIACEAPAKVAVKSIDARKGTAVLPIGERLLDSVINSSAHLLGLGQANGKNIGGYAMSIAQGSVQLNGSTPAYDVRSRNLGKSWMNSVAGSWMGGEGDREIFSWAKIGQLSPTPFTTMSGTLNVQAYINKSSELDLTKAIQLDGQSTIELIYL